MNNNKEYSTGLTLRENFLISLLSRVIKEYKLLLESARGSKPFKIIEILSVSSIPGEAQFLIQVSNKNCVLHLSAAEIINSNYNLNNFSDFHAEIIRQAAQGKLIDFLKISEKIPPYRILSKRFDKTIQQYIFTIEAKNNILFNATAEELSKNKIILSNISQQDAYNIGYTKGAESILNEKFAFTCK